MADKIVTLTSPDGATLNTAGTYCEGNIEVVPKLQSKTATTGEIVTADDGYVGLENVDTAPVFEAGKKSEYDAFWDAYQSLGARIDYFGAFGSHWTNDIFKPKYDLIVTGGYMMFRDSQLVGDLDEILSNLGRSMTCKNISSAYMMFAYSNFTALGTLDFRTVGIANYAFDSDNLKTIRKLILSEKSALSADMFYDCRSLENLTIEGTIGRNGFNVSWSTNLTHDSLMSIINALQDKTSDTSGTAWIVTIGEANRAKLTDEELYIAEAKSWEVK